MCVPQHEQNQYKESSQPKSNQQGPFQRHIRNCHAIQLNVAPGSAKNILLSTRTYPGLSGEDLHIE